MFAFVTNVYGYLFTGFVLIYNYIQLFTAKKGLSVLSFGWLTAVTYYGSYKTIKKTFWHLYVVGNEGLPLKKSNFIFDLTFSAILGVYFGIFPTFPDPFSVVHFLLCFVLFNRLSFRSGRLNTAGGLLNRCGGAPSSHCSQLSRLPSGWLCACRVVCAQQLLPAVRQAPGLRALPAPRLPQARRAHA